MEIRIRDGDIPFNWCPSCYEVLSGWAGECKCGVRGILGSGGEVDPYDTMSHHFRCGTWRNKVDGREPFYILLDRIRHGTLRLKRDVGNENISSTKT